MKKMRISKRKLQQIIFEEIANVASKGRLSDTSVDDQIDSLLMRGEAESVVDDPADSDVDVQESHRYSLSILFEAPDDEEEGEEMDPDLAPDDEEEKGGEFASSEDVSSNADSKAEPRKPLINVDQFAQRVSRLVQNAQNMLDIETVILTRARNYLVQNYGKDIAEKFEDTLEKQFDLSLEPKDNDPRPPPAVGAGPGGV